MNTKDNLKTTHIDMFGRVTLKDAMNWKSGDKIAVLCTEDAIWMKKADFIDKLVNLGNYNYTITQNENKRSGIYELRKSRVAIRTVDEFGRILIPIEMRIKLHIKEEQLFIEDNKQNRIKLTKQTECLEQKNGECSMLVVKKHNDNKKQKIKLSKKLNKIEKLILDNKDAVLKKINTLQEKYSYICIQNNELDIGNIENYIKIHHDDMRIKRNKDIIYISEDFIDKLLVDEIIFMAKDDGMLQIANIIKQMIRNGSQMKEFCLEKIIEEIKIDNHFLNKNERIIMKRKITKVIKCFYVKLMKESMISFYLDKKGIIRGALFVVKEFTLKKVFETLN